MSSIVRLETGPVYPMSDAVPADKVVRGNPFTGLRSAHEDETRGFYAGVWESSVGSWRVDYTEDEVCVIVQGRVRLVAEDGEMQEFRAGDAFVVRRGFKGIWETLEAARKVYTILL